MLRRRKCSHRLLANNKRGSTVDGLIQAIIDHARKRSILLKDSLKPYKSFDYEIYICILPIKAFCRSQYRYANQYD